MIQWLPCVLNRIAGTALYFCRFSAYWRLLLRQKTLFFLFQPDFDSYRSKKTTRRIFRASHLHDKLILNHVLLATMLSTSQQ